MYKTLFDKTYNTYCIQCRKVSYTRYPSSFWAHGLVHALVIPRPEVNPALIDAVEKCADAWRSGEDVKPVGSFLASCLEQHR